MPFATVHGTVQAKNFSKIGIHACAPSRFPSLLNCAGHCGGLAAAAPSQSDPIYINAARKEHPNWEGRLPSRLFKRRDALPRVPNFIGKMPVAHLVNLDLRCCGLRVGFFLDPPDLTRMERAKPVIGQRSSLATTAGSFYCPG
jgi:hypothetical protein